MSKIEWTEKTWNPIRALDTATGKTGWHCEHVSEGCRNCYAEAINRWQGNGLLYKPGQRGRLHIHIDRAHLDLPHRWRKPRMIFVCSMTDLFGAFVSDELISEVAAVMHAEPQHTYQVLTKRSERAAQWRLPDHVWRGVSIEDRAALPRLDHLRATKAYVKFLSIEPQLEDLGDIDLTDIDWVIVGGESGKRARPFDMTWMRRLVDRAAEFGVPIFCKQIGARPYVRHITSDGFADTFFWPKDKKGGDMAEWPGVVPRLREWPRSEPASQCSVE
jgi:protein gp37